MWDGFPFPGHPRGDGRFCCRRQRRGRVAKIEAKRNQNRYGIAPKMDARIYLN